MHPWCVHVALKTTTALPVLLAATETLGPDEGLSSITFVSPSEISLIFETKVKADAVALGFAVALAVAVAVSYTHLTLPTTPYV